MTGLAPGVVFAGDYRIVRPLSAGGMGAVYVVEQLSTRKQRALKLMHPQLLSDESSRRRFEQEARVGSQIPSDHVVDVMAAGVDATTGSPFLVMELLQGEDLETTLRRGRRLAPNEVAMLMEQICHAVGAAHAAGIVHRDLKPANVFLAEARRTDATFTVKVLDFGIAKLVSENTAETAALGSPLWLAPEQTERRAVTPATDVWALGLIAYALLAGRSFWRTATLPDASLMHVMREVLIDPMPPASVRAAEQGAQLPAGFDQWFARCVARDPAARYQDARQLFADLVPLLGYRRSGEFGFGSAGDRVLPGSAAPYVTRRDSQVFSGSDRGSDSGSAVAPAGTAPGASLPAKHRRGLGGGVLALGCAGTAAVGALLVAATVVTAAIVLRDPGAARPAASSAQGEVSDTEAPDVHASDETDVALSEEPEPDTDDAPAPVRGAEDTRPPPQAQAPAGAEPAPPPADTSPKRSNDSRKAVVTALLGGSNVDALPPDGSSVIRSRVPQFRRCYERGIAGDDEDHFGESMIVYLHINAQGGIDRVESRIDNAPPGVGTCVLPILRSIRFSPPPSGPVQGNLIINFRTE